jgi:hypothetical protein
MPEPSVSLEIHPEGGGLRLDIPRVDFFDGVSGLLAFDFTPGGVWECDGCRFEPRPGQIIRLTSGRGAMRYGNTAIEISPGRADHVAPVLRDGAPPSADAVRVQVGFITPYTHSLTMCVR